MTIKVRKHSGKSVFAWRVYRVTNGPVAHIIQLAKYRTQDAAERAADHYRKNDERIAETSRQQFSTLRDLSDA